MAVSGAERARESDPRRYDSMKSRPMNSEGEAAALELIDIDLCRTFPDNIYFSSETADDAKSLVSGKFTPTPARLSHFQVLEHISCSYSFFRNKTT